MSSALGSGDSCSEVGRSRPRRSVLFASRSSISRLLFVLLFAVGVGFAGSCSDTTAPQSGYGSWDVMESPTAENLRGVWGFDTGEAFAVGDNGTILYYDGSKWNPMETGATADLIGVWGFSPTQVVATGESGTVLFYDGSRWSRMESGTTDRIGAVWGCPDRDLESSYGFRAYAVGGGAPGSVIHMNGRGEWASVQTGATEEFTDIAGWGTAEELETVHLMAVGKGGTAYVGSVRIADMPDFDEEEWSATDTGVAEDLAGIVGDAPNNVYVIGTNGSVIQNTNQFVNTGPMAAWRTVGQLGGGLSAVAARTYNDLFVVGENGAAVHFDRAAFDDMKTGTTVALNDVWSGADVLYAVGDGGTILRYDEPPKTRACPFDTKLTATHGTTPEISWTPSCPVAKVAVENESGDLLWLVAADGNLIDPGVEYGTAPEGTVELRPTRTPLTPNEVYRVTLIRRDWDRERIVGIWNLLPREDGASAAVSVARAAAPSVGEDGYFYFVGLRPIAPPDVYEFADLRRIPARVWGTPQWRMLGDPVTREQELNVRWVGIEVLETDPETGQLYLVAYWDIRAADPLPASGGDPVTVAWDHVHVERR